MSKGTGIVGMLVALMFGYWLGNQVVPKIKGETAAEVAEGGTKAMLGEGATGGVERFRVPLGTSPIQGRDTAKVTIVEFSDFQCPFCSRVVDTLKQVEKTYGDK